MGRLLGLGDHRQGSNHRHDSCDSIRVYFAIKAQVSKLYLKNGLLATKHTGLLIIRYGLDRGCNLSTGCGTPELGELTDAK